MTGYRQPSAERGCARKVNLGRDYERHAERLSQRHGKRYGVYRCPHCQGTHLTTKLENAGFYAEPLLYVTSTSATPETDALWDPIRGSAFWTNHPARLLSEKLESQRQALAELLERVVEDQDGTGDEIGARYLRRHLREIMVKQNASGDARRDNSPLA